LAETFAQRVLTLRQERGLLQKELGEAIGVSADAICTMERGKRYGSMEVIVKLACYLGVSIDYLMGLTDKREVNR
jgi:transcriptional regulator with XRE-family HTH domain